MLFRSLVILAALSALIALQKVYGQGADRSGQEVVRDQCVKCHEAGIGGAPKIGDRAAWAPRMKQGIDNLARSAIRGHGGMPPRGGQANLTDSEIRNAVLHMFNPDATAMGGATGAPGSVQSNATQKTVGGLKIFLGFTSAESLLAFPADSIERTMHGGVPKGSGYYHLNVSLFDRMSGAPVPDAPHALPAGALPLKWKLHDRRHERGGWGLDLPGPGRDALA